MADHGNGNGKKRYYKKNYGKYYTYRRIRGMMKTYFRVKLTAVITTVIHQGNYAMILTSANGQVQQSLVTITLEQLCHEAPKYESYRQVFGYYKCRGVVIEAVPAQSASSYVVGNQAVLPYEGNVRLGITNLDQNQQIPTFRELSELNMNMALSTVGVSRKYFAFLVKDFTEFPTTANALPGGVPYHVIIASSSNVNVQNRSFPHWTVNFTFYMTLRQSTN